MSARPPRPDVVEPLAAAVGDCWQEICGYPERWAALPEFKRETFRAMIRSAIAAGRAGARGEDEIAQVLNEAFWADHSRARGAPVWPWASLSDLKRDVFRRLARRLAEAGRELRSSRQAAA